MNPGFVKHNHGPHADQLRCEAAGLAALRAAAVGSGVEVPQVLQVDEHTLTLPRIEVVPAGEAHWRRLGAGLAAIHERPQERHGWEGDNYIGANPQRNGWCASWGEFFVRQRLEVQIGFVGDRQRQREFAQRLAARAPRLREFLDAACATPSLLHGDLWRGNVLCDAEGRVWLIDPAVYCGDADADLAMTQLFGGFGAAFYAAYRAQRAAAPSYPLKRRIYNLYHLLNHYNLFGDGYLAACEDGFAALDEL